MSTDDDSLAEFEKLGEDKVRRKLAKGEYGSVGEHRLRVEAWLVMRAQARIDASSRAQIRLAPQAKNAAFIAAIAAIIAAISTIVMPFLV